MSKSEEGNGGSAPGGSINQLLVCDVEQIPWPILTSFFPEIYIEHL